ncbi:MAG: arsenosugar biosynthesis radical SAM protein ArsS [Algoriphagus sp.]|jgi:radical SAM/Cys-rich protein|uniref:arsenosugar biosynthesis radical SAM (seleno)protein ArsS n=1 Tax=Algoriphagus sp. TaxID=1872435 RepID=UPI00271BB68D|nr:arsenosugar biosynthesis radical SAM (seleno)protein ArsS [Algoriphagus sp.]MDO8968075.1 arsenosugar biosynthesis radical SAM protein ArsS [Algoriphagus sp.]MDP2041647.1 arsenosugar biosynthesis radical SAM protein ArsS [Algoriphagus sp.]MDP3202176.1 arsenosugar biosynthesis radical SAM protein ArsS [Algoriphagus sp.]MDP3473204.1 arsenosugar biosynthesis radical SAM protein ArsS [Algoriphagus sp.]
MKSLKAQLHSLADPEEELAVLEERHPGGQKNNFQSHLEGIGLFPLQPTTLEIFQINLGKMCNQVCKHCHVDAGPDRKEIMTRETMKSCLDVIQNEPFLNCVDLTGGAPEMNPDFRWFVESIRSIRPDIKIIVRCNLTIILANPKFHDLPEFFKRNTIEVVSSLPYFTAMKTDAQRGDGVFEKSIRALRMLNEVGYGIEGSDLVLNLVYNPSGAFLPGSQSELEAEFKKKLKERFDIEFNSLFTITNIPISRFLEYLLRSDNFENYMEKLLSAFNPSAAAGVMCRNTISIGWDGYLYDCDFNQMLDMKVNTPNSIHLSEWDSSALSNRSIQINNHCFGCTAGAGSSCGGATA